jgi:hypothetical protein
MTRPAKTELPKPPRGEPARKPSIADNPGYWELLEWACFLADLVKENGLTGSAVVKEFALFKALMAREPKTEAEYMRVDEQANVALREWERLSWGEKRRILRGWHPAKQPPGLAEFLHYLGGLADQCVEWGLDMRVDCEGRVRCFADFGVVNDTAGTSVHFRPGTKREEVLSDLRKIMEAVKSRWPEMIALDGREGLTVAVPAEAVAVPGPAARIPELLPVGTLIEDTSQNASGIIVGAFKGEKEIVYVYVRPDGEVDSQYAMAVEPSPQNRGGLPLVTDIHGHDPLARFRAVNGNAETGDGRALGLMAKALGVEEKRREPESRWVFDMWGKRVYQERPGVPAPGKAKVARKSAA